MSNAITIYARLHFLTDDDGKRLIDGLMVVGENELPAKKRKEIFDTLIRKFNRAGQQENLSLVSQLRAGLIDGNDEWVPTNEDPTSSLDTEEEPTTEPTSSESSESTTESSSSESLRESPEETSEETTTEDEVDSSKID
jgi:hypothetical protein